MKSLLTILAVAVCAVAFGGNSCTWTGEKGNGLWSDPGNWGGGVAPQDGNGDSVVISSAGALAGDDGVPEITVGEETSISRLEIAGGSGAFRLKGAKIRLCLIKAGDQTGDASALYCAAANVLVEIANNLEICDGGYFLTQVQQSNLMLSGGVSGSGAYFEKRVQGSDDGLKTDTARLTLSGPCTITGASQAATFVLRSGRTVFAHSLCVGTDKAARLYGGVYEFPGGCSYENFFETTGVSWKSYFAGETVFARAFHNTSGYAGNYEMYFVNATKVHFLGDLDLSYGGTAKSNLWIDDDRKVTVFRVDGDFPLSSDRSDRLNGYWGEMYVDFWLTNARSIPLATTAVNHLNIHALAVDALPTDAKLVWGVSADATHGVIDLNGFDQHIDRIIYSSKDDLGYGRVVKTETPAKLILNATASDRCQCRLQGPLSLVYAAADSAYEQEFYGNAYEASGDIVVSNGVLRLGTGATYANAERIYVANGGVFENASSAVQPLAKVRTVVVENGGAFRLSANINPFAEAPTFEIGETAKLSFPASLAAGGFVVRQNGVLVAGGRYQPLDGADPTATRVSWLESGSAAVSVNENPALWRSAVDGAWNDASKWTVQPSATIGAKILESGNFAVRIEEPAGVQTNLEVVNASGTTTLAVSNALVWADLSTVRLGKGSKMIVGTGGSVLRKGDAAVSSKVASTRLSVVDGAELAVDGGTFATEDMIGDVEISSADAEKPSRVTVKDGSFTYLAKGRTSVSHVPSRLRIGEGGLFSATNATVRFRSADGDYAPIDQVGGELRFEGDSNVQVAGPWNVYLGSGLTHFGGNTAFRIAKDGLSSKPRFYTAMTAPGVTNVIEIADHATFGALDDSVANVDQMIFGYLTPGNLTRVDYTSDAKSSFIPQLVIGAVYGYTEMNVDAGLVTGGSYGLSVGGFAYTTVADADVVGVLRVRGGSVFVNASGYYESENRLRGLMVGDGWYNVKSADTHNLFTGRIELEDGAITNYTSSVMLGAGCADGRILQTGGEFVNRNTVAKCPMVLGWLGGTGAYILSNGVCRVTDSRTTVYVGGVEQAATYWTLDPGRPTSEDPAHGLLSVQGGQMEVTGDVVVSADGFGTVDIGPAGLLTAHSLVLSNSVVHASTAALKFTCGSKGVGRVDLTGSLVITDGATLEVDLGDYDCAKSVRLVSADGMIGSFDSASVSIRGTAEQRRSVRIVQDRKGVRLGCLKGLTIIVR